ncbi:MAG: Crp/Fnr family transcriptional regulator [Pseudomonadota bacterium]
MTGRRNPKNNAFLSKLSPELYAQIIPELQIISLPRDCDIYQTAGKIDYIYFPISSIVAVVKVLMDGESPEIATIGKDGLVGLDAFMGVYSSTSRFVVQSTGMAYRLKSGFAKKLFDSEPEFRALVLRYIHVVFSHSAQIAACNRFHQLQQQVCRFLLTSLDLWSSNRISLTHQRVADLLGVRRSGVSEVSANLAKLGLIEYHRGCVTVLDRTGLEEMVCECYGVIKQENNLFLP